MNVSHMSLLTSILTLVALIGCSSPAPSARNGGSDQPQQPRRETTLRVISRFEPQSLAAKYQEAGGVVAYKGLLNAGLVAIDYQNRGKPVLAERLPELNTDTWKVTPDGRMETSYKLKSGLKWHDGQPLTAEDFAFA